MTKKLVLAIAAIAVLHAQTPDPGGSITFLILDQAGRSLDHWKVTSFRSNQYDGTQSFKGLSAQQLPQGFYSYSISGVGDARWTPTVGGQVEVYRADKFIVKVVTEDILNGAAIDRFLPRDFVIIGKVDPLPAAIKGQPVWVHVHPVIHGNDVNALVEADGTVRIYGFLSGPCNLNVIREGVLLHSESITFDRQSNPRSFVLHLK